MQLTPRHRQQILQRASMRKADEPEVEENNTPSPMTNDLPLMTLMTIYSLLSETLRLVLLGEKGEAKKSLDKAQIMLKSFAGAHSTQNTVGAGSQSGNQGVASK